MTNLWVDVPLVPGEATLTLTLPAGPTPLGPDVRLAQPAEVHVRLDGDRLQARVDVAADLALTAPCDRCLEAVSIALPVAYGEEWALGPDAAEADPPEDGPVLHRTVAGPAVDLTDGFWQNAALEFPAKILCADSCRGLCPRCGANLNREACTCPGPEVDQRLAALANWHPDPDHRR